MAKCEFPECFGLVRGTLSKTTIRSKHDRETVRVVAKVYDGKQHVYIQRSIQRSTPVTPEELQRREWFAEANKKTSEIMKQPDILEAYHEQWVADGHYFRCKRYNSLRGYILARLYNELKNN